MGAQIGPLVKNMAVLEVRVEVVVPVEVVVVRECANSAVRSNS